MQKSEYAAMIAMVCLLSLGIGSLVIACLESSKPYVPLPCSDYADTPARNVPLRCFK